MDNDENSFHGSFQTTRWSIVLDAKSQPQSGEQWQESIQNLCESYWFPLYAYLRRKGYSPDDCQDLVQSFFGALIEKDFLKVVEPQKGRFRWFLMDAIGKFASSWNAANATKKRGGNQTVVSIDVQASESRYQTEPTDNETPEKIFEKQWALSVIDQAMENLKASYYHDGKRALFDGLKPYLIPDRNQSSYAETAELLDLTETAIKVAIHRLRQKFALAIRSVVLQTLDDPQDLDEEVNSLLKSLS